MLPLGSTESIKSIETYDFRCQYEETIPLLNPNPLLLHPQQNKFLINDDPSPMSISEEDTFETTSEMSDVSETSEISEVSELSDVSETKSNVTTTTLQTEQKVQYLYNTWVNSEKNALGKFGL